MAIPTLHEVGLIERYGPHLQYEPPGGWTDHPDSTLVKTHC